MNTEGERYEKKKKVFFNFLNALAARRIGHRTHFRNRRVRIPPGFFRENKSNAAVFA
jgi:hypothetical protein